MKPVSETFCFSLEYKEYKPNNIFPQHTHKTMISMGHLVYEINVYPQTRCNWDWERDWEWSSTGAVRNLKVEFTEVEGKRMSGGNMNPGTQPYLTWMNIEGGETKVDATREAP